MYAENLYIALYDAARGAINFPYYVDTVESDIPDPRVWEPFGVGNARGSTAYVLRTGQPALITPGGFRDLVARGEVELVGVLADGDWLGVPLTAEGETLGVLVVQSYTAENRYTEGDRDLLAFVGRHVGIALSRVRTVEEARQRNAELAVVNEIGQALARQLEFDAIVDLIGERVRAIFEAPNMFVALVDEANGLITFPYEMSAGERIRTDPLRIGEGLSSRVIRDRRPLRTDTMAEAIPLGVVVTGTVAESWLGVPIVTGDRVLGLLALESTEPYAFDDADERLLATVASSMGVALENARLFDETKRLLTETGERNAELAVINEIGQALSRQLEFDAIIHLVGERVREMFDVRSIFIALHDPVDEPHHVAVRHRRGRAVPSRSPAARGGADVHGDQGEAAPPRRDCRGAGGRRSAPDRRHGHAVVARRADQRREPASSASSAWRASRLTRSPRRTNDCSPPSRRAWAWRSRTPACSTRRNACSPRRTSGPPSWRSSTRSRTGLAVADRHAGDVRRRRGPGARPVRRPGGRHRDRRPCLRDRHLRVHDRTRCPVPRGDDPAHRDPQARRRDGAALPRQREPRGVGEAVRAARRPVRRGAPVGAVRAPDRARRGDRRDLAPEHRPRACVLGLRRPRADDARRQPERVARERPPDPRDAPAGDRAGDGQRDRPGAGEPARPRPDVRAGRRPDARHVLGRPRVRGDARRRDGPHRVRLLHAKAASAAPNRA